MDVAVIVNPAADVPARFPRVASWVTITAYVPDCVLLPVAETPTRLSLACPIAANNLPIPAALALIAAASLALSNASVPSA